MEKSSVWPAVGLSLVLLISVINLGYIYSLAKNDVVVPTAEEIAAKVRVTSTNVVYNDSALNTKVDKLTNEVLKSDLKEVKAEELVLDEINSRDFKRVLQNFLNDELNSSSEIENYKDIESIIVKDKDIVVSGDSASVELILKVSYFLDGDDDTEDLESAKVVIEFSVEDLDEDDKYVDAEVDNYSESDMTLVKFYD